MVKQRRMCDIALRAVLLFAVVHALLALPRDAGDGEGVKEESYTLLAVLQKPSNITLAGTVGERCVRVLDAWSEPAQAQRDHVPLRAFTAVLPENVQSLKVGELFRVSNLFCAVC